MGRRVAWLSLGLALAGTTGGVATAKGPHVDTNFTVRGSNGYTLWVNGFGKQVHVTAGAGDGSASYTVPGRVTPRGVWADLGKRGRIEVEFRPSGNLTRRVPPSHCEGEPRVSRQGAFVGTISFNGERGFTRARASRAPGSTHVTPAWKCKRRGRQGGRACEPSGETTESVELEAASPPRGVNFAAFAESSPDGFGRPGFFASTLERRGRMEIARFAFVTGPESAFAYDAGLALAIVSPPSPFSGSATFRRVDGIASWTGDLRVSLPGTPEVALTGPAFEAGLKRRSRKLGSDCISVSLPD
jgi:hypothetical protein